MITGIISALIVIAVLPSAANNGEWGAFWTAIVIIVLLLFFGAVSREDDRAHNNAVRYWATGERPEDWNRRPERKVVYRRKSRAEKRAEAEEAQRKRAAYKATLERGLRTDGRIETLTCPTCRRRMQTITKLVTVDGEDWLICTCSKCGAKLSRKR